MTIATIWFFSMTGNFTSLPQYFTENGYETYSIGKVFHPNGHNPDDIPFSWNILPPFHPSTLKYKNAALCPPDNQTNLLCPVELNSQPEKTLPDIQTTKEAVRFLKSKYEDVGTITNNIKGIFMYFYYNIYPQQYNYSIFLILFQEQQE